MDESVLYPQGNVEVIVPLPVPEEESERDALAKDPRRMLSISMSRRERLPDDLHQAMVMWSFHPEYHLICKLYFEWASFCDGLEEKKFSLFDSVKRRLSWRISFRGLCAWASSRLMTWKGSVRSTSRP